MNNEMQEYLNELKQAKDSNVAQDLRKHLIPEESFDTQMQKAAKIYKDEIDIVNMAKKISENKIDTSS